MSCQLCGDTTSFRFCNFCDKLYFKEEKLREVKREIPKKIIRRLSEKSCEKCNKTYQPKSKYQKFCSDECRPKKLTPAQKWLNKKEHVNRADSDAVAYSFFRKKDCAWMNKFKVFRG